MSSRSGMQKTTESIKKESSNMELTASEKALLKLYVVQLRIICSQIKNHKYEPKEKFNVLMHISQMFNPEVE